MITKQDFEIYLDLMANYYGVQREELRVTASNVEEGETYDFFDQAKIISILDSGIIVWKYEEEEDNESVFVPWSAINEISITLQEIDEEDNEEECI